MREYHNRTVILADGDFPSHPVPLAALRNASRVVCCDGAAAELLARGRQPDVIVGDLDSLPATLRERHAALLVHDPSQETNDLAKAFRHCLAQGWRDPVILGAGGRREDHALGNFSLLADFALEAPETVILTDHGVLLPLAAPGRVATFPGQQVSVFAFDPATKIQSRGLRWPLEGLRLSRWWQAALNEATGDEIGLNFDGGPVLVYLAHGDSVRCPVSGVHIGCRPARAENLADALPVALTIAGSDSGGNAGIQADLRVFHAMRVHGCTAIAALTAQNPGGVGGVLLATAENLGQQLDAILGCYDVTALKTGMLATDGLIGVVAERLAAYPAILKVVDPVMVATSGARLLEAGAEAALRDKLLPLATLMTPNLPEAAVLLGARIATEAETRSAAAALARRFGCGVLLKGGHDPKHPARDWLCLRESAGDGWRICALETPVIGAPRSTHGTGCTLSAAIAAALARGCPLTEAVVEGKAFVYESIRTGRAVGRSATVLGQPEQLPVAVVSVGEWVSC